MAGRLKLIGQAKYQNDGDPRTSGPGFALTCHPDELARPATWRRPTRVFVNSMSDLFHQDVPLEFILGVWSTMANADRHTYQILTKRPQRMQRIVSSIAWDGGTNGDPWEAYAWPGHWEDENGDYWDAEESDLDGGGEVPLRNVWLGVSIEDDRYTFRADHLRKTPAAVRFVSLEPLLGPIPSLDLTGIHWAIVGAESGKGARPMELDWVREIKAKADAAGAALFVKQLSGGFHAVKDMDLFPGDLRIRDYPKAAA
jgi:protein gp37